MSDPAIGKPPGKHYSPEVLSDVATRILMAAGTPGEIAEQVAALLVWSERIGHPSHGLLRIRPYLERIRAGRLAPAATPTVVRESDSVSVLDGHWGFGQVSAMTAADLAIDKASKQGVSVVGAYHINHIGRLGDYTERCAGKGLVGILLVGGAPTGMLGNVAPFGGRSPVWGTNPLAIAVPVEDEVFSLDFATSLIAGGKAAAARARGEMLDGEHLIDVDGKATNDPWALERGGAIRPFGDHKGYALAFAIELLAGAMVGAMAPELARGDLHNGMLMIVIDPSGLGDAEVFRASARSIIEKVRASPTAEGFSEVLIPGEPELRRLRESDTTGIGLPPTLVDELSQLASELGVEVAL
jgi:LDH2 family malate/lactate/ureidoglycolate dehydrogenase